MASEVLEIENLDQHLLLKNEIHYSNSISNFFEGQTSFMPRARMLNEKRCLKIWRKAGIRVYDTYEDVIVKGLPEGGYMLFEYLSTVKFIDYFGDASVALEDRLHTYRRFLKEWHRRHAMAIKQKEPRLVHENGDMKHVMIVDDQFLFFDFEMVYRSGRRVTEFVTREILAYLKSLGKTVGPELFPVFIKETIDHYPDTELLQNTYRIMFAHPSPIHRMARILDRRFSSGAKKTFSKHNVARQLNEMLAGHTDHAG